MANIAGWKIDKLASLMTSNLEKELKDIEEKMRRSLHTAFVKRVPIDVAVFAKKYPDRIRQQERFVFKYKNHHFYLNPKVPHLDMDVEVDIVYQNSAIHNTLLRFGKECVNLRDKKRKLENRIKCTVASLKSYRKLEKEFPEAHECLVILIDGKEKTANTCDDVEKLRAELSAKN